MKSSLEIAQEATLKPIIDVAKTLGLTEDDLELHGKVIAKIALSKEREEEIKKQPKGRYVLVTAITPTPAGEGKTTTAIGLTQGLNKIGKRAIVTLRQPSLGPVFGIKGGAAGAGYAQVLPMEEINLGFTGDFNKIESAHNLLSALLDNHLFRDNKLNFDIENVAWKRCMDMNDRALRGIVVANGDPKIVGVKRESGFDITAASEVMALMALADDLQDVKKRIERIVVGRTPEGKVITAKDLSAPGAMTALLKHAVKPNLVQTYEGAPATVHIGPFGNIATGTSSVIADKLAIHMSDYVVTEAGFGSDLGAEKFFNIKCRAAGMYPDAVVLVTTVKALKFHGTDEPFDREKIKIPNLEQVKKGIENLGKHIENMKSFGTPVIVALNYFPHDTDEEIEFIRNYALENGADGFSISKGVALGGEGTEELATIVDETITKHGPVTPNFTYDLEDEIETKIEKISKSIYGASGVNYTDKAKEVIAQLKQDGYGDLPICMAKTHLSLSDDQTKRGAPKDFEITISDVRLSAGAGFIFPQTGKILTMPGLGPVPAANNIDIDQTGKITGLF
ncbi:MAG: formate--tetrahydrofolate ligase [Candidatus Heimdallarchaeota archaeon]|nr:formate--tetrahydrofolate ligase [Candidatus Heimdallarchaeota archaeon]